jgi:hypothetical protein
LQLSNFFLFFPIRAIREIRGKIFAEMRDSDGMHCRGKTDPESGIANRDVLSFSPAQIIPPSGNARQRSLPHRLKNEPNYG